MFALIMHVVKKLLRPIPVCTCSQVQQSVDGVMEYLLHNTPLNWLVGPFAPLLTERAEGDVAMEHAGPDN